MTFFLGGYSSWLLSESVEFGEVVGEHAVTAPDPGSGVTVKSSATPAKVSFEV